MQSRANLNGGAPASDLTLPPGIRGLIFDCDGTVADTMPLHYLAWEVLAQRHQFTFPKDRFYALGGVPSRDILRTLKAEQSLALDPLVVAREKEDEYLKMLHRITPIDAILDIARAHYGRLPLAIASGGTRRVITTVLEHLQIRHLFDAVVTNEDIQNQKPAPDIFLRAAELLKIAPQACCVIEDSKAGVAAGVAAGMQVIAITNTYPADELRHATHVVRTYEEIERRLLA